MRWNTGIGNRLWPNEIGNFVSGIKRSTIGAIVAQFRAAPRDARKHGLHVPPRVTAAREAMPAVAIGILDRRQVRLRRD
ncbi:MAG TPA: hypothetical protein PLR41_04345 [Alphaproteobacteria bacterium]|nr:hypothetical protein [Alphaproteobacteria bacterium]